ncbi:VOC family protein [Altererythrobacter sp.]|uniref:VOC family protein n=1 Tax=Altererythrobacter sp. TaxID=1872480 RepID=UPI003D0C17CA
MDVTPLIAVDEAPPPPPPFDLRNHHCGISVPDLEASIAWYRDMLGFAVELRTNMPQVPFSGAFLKRGSTRIELFERPGAAPLPPDRRDPDADLATHGTKHMALEVSDIHGAFAFLTERGVEVAMPIFKCCGMSAGYIRDNAGNLIELIEHEDGRRGL